MSTKNKTITAAVIIIGDEILSGRTRDANLAHIAKVLNDVGVQVKTARIVADVEDDIVQAVNECRAVYDYVFTTGGIGPTHDDITADAVAKAFGVGIDYNPQAMAILTAHYEGGDFNDARKRMARIPDGATLIDNPVSKAPGFRIENVFVLAGIPKIVEVMMQSVRSQLEGGALLLNRTIEAAVAEGQIAAGLEDIENAFQGLSVGSYPSYRAKRFGVAIVLRSTEDTVLDAACARVVALIKDLGAEPHIFSD